MLEGLEARTNQYTWKDWFPPGWPLYKHAMLSDEIGIVPDRLMNMKGPAGRIYETAYFMYNASAWPIAAAFLGDWTNYMLGR